MGGKAVNGWRFWSVEGVEPKAQEGGEKPRDAGLKVKEARLPRPEPEGPEQKVRAAGSCKACMKGFVIEGGGTTGGLPGRPPRRAGADHGSGPSGGSKRVGADDAGDEAPSGACHVHGVCNGLRTQKASMRKAT